METNILGTDYSVSYSDETKDPKLKECDGYCDNTIKQCVLVDCVKEAKELLSKGNLNEYKKKITRHELIHAFLYESGLGENSDWAQNEEMVDWLAFQFPKLLKAFQEINCI